jgi:phosphatidylglycerophosphatase A
MTTLVQFFRELRQRQQQKTATPIPQSIWTNPIHFIACGFGIGLLPFPGTFGTLAAIPFYLVMMKLPLLLYILITLALILVGVWLCGVTNRDFGTEDHPAAVWDEIACFLIVMIAIPPRWYYLLLGFILFRIFDIWKPGPIGWVDRHVHGGLGVMLDDVVAAIVSWIILFMAVHFATIG